MSVGAADDVEQTTEEEAVDQAAEEQETSEAGAEQEEAQSQEEQGAEGSSEDATDGDSDDDAPPEWRDDDTRALASSYGIEESELAEFESSSDFYRACRLLDRQMTRGLAKAQEEPSEGAETVEEPAAEGTSEEPAAEAPADDLAIDPAQWKEYDDATQHLVRAVAQSQKDNRALREELARLSQMREELDRLEEARQEQLHQAELARFHDVMDRMDKQFFGGEGDLTEEHNGRREKVWNAFRIIAESLPREESGTGRPAKGPSTEVLVRRAALMEFGDEMIDAERKRIYGEIHEQSRKRRPSPGGRKKGGPPTGPDAQSMTIAEQRQAILQDPEIAAIFDRAEEESGNAPQ